MLASSGEHQFFILVEEYSFNSAMVKCVYYGWENSPRGGCEFLYVWSLNVGSANANSGPMGSGGPRLSELLDYQRVIHLPHLATLKSTKTFEVERFPLNSLGGSLANHWLGPTLLCRSSL